MKFKETKHGVSLECQAAICDYPFLYLEPGRVGINSRHQHRTHPNYLTSAELRKLADIVDEMESTCDTLKPDQAA